MSGKSQFMNYSLSGEWELTWLNTGEGRIEDADRLYAENQTVSCMVPGDVHIALTDAGVIRDPLKDKNSTECRWMEEKEFWYRKSFFIEKDFLQDYTELIFEGLDLTADIWLNGIYIGSHNNAFISKVIDVSSCIRAGENLLIVRIDDGVHGVKEKPVDFMERSWNNDQPYRAWMRKPQFVYGWDWTIWLPTCGIWKEVYINSFARGAIRDVYVKNEFEGGEITGTDNVTLNVSVDLACFCPGEYVLKCEISGDERYDNAEVALCSGSEEIKIQKADLSGKLSRSLRFTMEKPKLWWPNGAGKQYLYRVKVTLEDKEGNKIHSSVHKHGIRSVRIEEKVLDEHSKSFTFVINDCPIFAKGANHVPADCFPGRITDEKNRALLTAAAEAHMNMIRVWGGGIYESRGFMETCDELGLMVWHDFLFACAYYPDHVPEFYEEIRKEAAEAIKRLRKHASLVGWSGNNEIQEMYESLRKSDKSFPWYGGRLYEELLPGLVRELCPDRIYRESSPFGGDEPTSYDEGDQHTWHFTHRPGWEHYLDLWRFTDFDFKFLSEFGIIGAMNIESARKCIREEALDPDSEEWLHHTNSSSEHQLLNIFVKKYFDTDVKLNLQDYILRSQVIQAEMMRHVYDELRSRKFRCSGLLLWTLSDSYGINNWSVIDYYLGKRPVYYYLKRSMAPVNIAFRGYEVQSFDGMQGYNDYYSGNTMPVEILLCNDTQEEKKLCLDYQILTFSGEELKCGQAVKTLAANAVEKFAEAELSDITDNFCPEETVLYAKASCEGQVCNENRYFFAPYKKLHLRAADIKYRRRQISEEKTEITFISDTFVWMLHLADEEGITFSDNDFDLFAGKEKVIVAEGVRSSTYVPQIFAINPGIRVTELV